MDPNEVWKNLLLAIRDGNAPASSAWAQYLAEWIKAEGRWPTGLWRALLESEMSE
jgi:hypothetical protein